VYGEMGLSGVVGNDESHDVVEMVSGETGDGELEDNHDLNMGGQAGIQV
jgi:hypothetical protein